MFIPIKTDVRITKPPLMNYFLIAVCIAVFLATYSPVEVKYGYKTFVEPLKPWADTFVLHSDQPKVWQFITYAFLHSNIVHIAGNMFFLFLFGNKINYRLGHIGYLCFFISGAIFAAVGYSYLHETAMLGASGAVAAVTGAYLILYPRSNITLMGWLFFYTFPIPAFWFILVKMVLIDNVIPANYVNSKVAYDAHLSGYAFGVVVTGFMLITRLLKSEGIDFHYMIKRWKRGRALRDSLQYEMKAAKSIRPEGQSSKYSSESYKLLNDSEQQICRLAAEGKIKDAADSYVSLLNNEHKSVLPENEQLDIANNLMGRGKAEQAEKAYKIFKANYPNYEYIEHIELMLGLLYSRYLNEPENAVKQLERACKKLSDPEQKKMCSNELKKAKKKL
ncbi:rhomboid family protease GlpG [Sedimentisphaera cyanobacteriorum]|uniref:Rhomboid family protease GlpG n=1 Tax=Sedimentisphaera cyanobacteriorum TaxID=1940790 RepID=A0A1Q2HQN6_9BACT|nr:rhomboid family intramembrane serine protease [Sedimentisphaera cyanobacteriorum]AQQ09553.1 rhomboid family protease GlpG [Sedimentisphaera cyanobacteriorum]